MSEQGLELAKVRRICACFTLNMLSGQDDDSAVQLESENVPAGAEDETQLETGRQLTRASQRFFEIAKVAAVKRSLKQIFTHLEDDHDEAVPFSVQRIDGNHL